MRKTLIGLVALSAGLADARPAEAYCREYVGAELTTWVGYAEIPVYIDEGLSDRLQRPDGSAWTSDEVINEATWMMRAINEYSGADAPRLYFAGLVPDCGGTMRESEVGPCHRADAVVITYRPLPSGIAGGASPFLDPSIGKVITINPFGPWRTGVGGGGSLIGGLMHEMLHVLGLSHPSDCDQACDPGQSPCSSVQRRGATGEFQELYIDDVLGLRDIYGADSQPPGNVRYHQAGDSLEVFTELSVARPDVLPMFQGSSGNAGDMFFGGRDPATLAPAAWRQPTFDGAFESWGDAPDDPGLGQVGAAWDPDTARGTLVYTNGEVPGFVDKTIAAREFYGPFDDEYAESDDVTRRPGASAAYNPIDDLTVIASRNSFGQVVFHVKPAGEGVIGAWPLWNTVDRIPVIAAETPSVACAELAPRNCIAVWADGQSAWHENRWIQFSVQWTGTEVLYDWGPLHSGPLTMLGAPQVAYRGTPDDPSAFMMLWTLHLGETSTPFTAGKSADETADFPFSSVTTHGVFTEKTWAGLGVPSQLTTVYLGG